MITFDPIINKRYDPDRLLEQCGHVMSEMGAGLHNFPEIASGRFNHEDEPAEYPRLVTFLKKECDWLHQRLKSLQVPRYLLEPRDKSITLGCWTHFCELIADTIDEHPEYGKIVSSEISEGSYRYIIFRMAKQCGAQISFIRNQKTLIKFEEPKNLISNASRWSLIPNWLFSPGNTDRFGSEESDGTQTVVITESDHEILVRQMREGLNDAGVKLRIEHPEASSCNFDPRETADLLIYRYMTVLAHCADKVGMGKFSSDNLSLDLSGLIDDLETMTQQIGLYLRDLGKVARGVSHIEGGPAQDDQLRKEVRDACRRVYLTIQNRSCPPQFRKNMAWQDFCDLVANIHGEEPEYGTERSYDLTREQLRLQVLRQAEVAGIDVRYPGILDKLLGREKIRIEIAPSKDTKGSAQ
jgi:hypothetical protein